MKKDTHPQLIDSIIQLKDGAAYNKKWLFFRPILQLEIDYLSHPLWKKAIKKSKQNLTKK